AHSSAYVQAIESLCRIDTTRRAQSIRAIALEMERIAIHIGDLAAISNDVAYLLGNSVFGANRTLIVNTLLAICGSRYGRGLIRPGGVVFDISPEISEEMAGTLKKVRWIIIDMCEKMFETPTVLSRLEHTGSVDLKTASDIGMTGIAARASGLPRDIRNDFPSGIYRYFPVHKITMDSGDVFARTYLRYVEIKQSIDFIMEQLENLQNTKTLITPLQKPSRSSFNVSMTEGWRGEIVHTAITDTSGKIARYKIKDPSFNNWFGLAQSVRGNGVSDFPLCNKSFNLSYAGHDL
ncbi:MAG: hydrogenase, partial [Clostridia bacterium]|nr:hydrogenase [Clostridia bacterium]